jgi:hypothetical protein
MFSMTKALVAGAMTAAALGATLVAAAPAEAHGSCAYLPNDRGFGCVLAGHTSAYVHDSRADNWGVRIHLWTTTSGTKYVVGDGNGSATGDGWKYISGETFTYYKVCAGVGGVDTVCTAVTPA